MYLTHILFTYMYIHFCGPSLPCSLKASLWHLRAPESAPTCYYSVVFVLQGFLLCSPGLLILKNASQSYLLPWVILCLYCPIPVSLRTDFLFGCKSNFFLNCILLFSPLWWSTLRGAGSFVFREIHKILKLLFKISEGGRFCMLFKRNGGEVLCMLKDRKIHNLSETKNETLTLPERC